MQGGYVGEYNGYILKSSYEYIFAKILEHDNIEYKFEEITYLLNDNTYYTPDFFLYDLDDKLYKIIEIRGHRLNIEERKESVNNLRKIITNDIEIELITEIDLRRMCKDRKMSYHQMKTYWCTNPNNIKCSNKGKANPMYGKKQKESTKEILKEKGIMRYKNNPEIYKQTTRKMIDWCRENNYDFLRGERVPRYTLICEWCGKEFKVIQGNKDIRKFCSVQCGSEHGFRIASDIKNQERLSRDDELREFILEWVNHNKEIVLNTPYNKIETTLNDLYNLINKTFNIIDWRTISRAFNVESRKKLLNILKESV